MKRETAAAIIIRRKLCDAQVEALQDLEFTTLCKLRAGDFTPQQFGHSDVEVCCTALTRNCSEQTRLIELAFDRFIKTTTES